MMRAHLEHIDERLDRVEEGTQQRQPPIAPNIQEGAGCTEEKLRMRMNLKEAV